MSGRAGDKNEQEKLKELATDYKAYDAWRMTEPGMVELFQQFPSLRVDSAELVRY